MLLVAHRTPPDRASCERLVAAGATVFEVDVQLDRHSELVASHYHPLRRFRWVARDNWRLRWHTVRDPRLADVEAAVPEGGVVLLDLKAREPAERTRLLRALDESLPLRSRYRACTSEPSDLAALRSAGFATWRTVGDAADLAAVLAEPRLPDEAVTVRHTLLDADVVARLHQRVASVVAWTVNDPRRAARLRELGVDGVTTDRIDVLRNLTAPIR
ncbi:MAG: glycerophosphodiester phosphodiesterase [Actinobacteria bacterium]|nr:glycerophosphodiester phosphodiesterase [Actinomycetota bacterium]